MTPAEKQKLKSLFVATSMYYSHEIPDPALQLYVDDLADLPFEIVAQALVTIRRDPKTTRCPLPAVIRSRITPAPDVDSQAIMLSGRIVEAISKIGPYRERQAREFIGEPGWRIVTMQGGWSSLCQIESDELGVRTAQWRQLAKAVLTMPPGHEVTALPAPGTKAIDVLKLLPKLPGGAA